MNIESMMETAKGQEVQGTQSPDEKVERWAGALRWQPLGCGRRPTLVGIAAGPQAWSEAARSRRRLVLHLDASRLVGELVSTASEAWSPFADQPSPVGFDIWASNGTCLKHDCHDPVIDGTRCATPQFFALNLRSHQRAHLTVGDRCPQTSKVFRCLTLLPPSVPPGVVAALHLAW